MGTRWDDPDVDALRHSLRAGLGHGEELLDPDRRAQFLADWRARQAQD